MTHKNDTSARNNFSESQLNHIYESVFRASTSAPGFYFQDMGKDIDSKSFRKVMIKLKEALSEICQNRSDQQLNYLWLGRFSHQKTSGFHRDNAAEHSFLILGYEPTEVDSKVFIADYSKLIEDQNISLNDYFQSDDEINHPKNTNILEPYITELTPFHKDHYRLLIVNNSKSLFEKTYGVFHRGEVIKSIEGSDRVLNSIMLKLSRSGESEQFSKQDILAFINTEKIDR